MTNPLDPTQESSKLSFKFKPVSSKGLSGYSYNDQSYVLTVQYPNGQVWSYFNVFPNVISQVFDSGGSIGSNFHHLVKTAGYLSQKLV